jgi:hypothetical protein
MRPAYAPNTFEFQKADPTYLIFSEIFVSAPSCK